MIDPFGVTGTPMDVVERILQNRQSEVYISFMFDFINRFLSTPEFEDKLDEEVLLRRGGLAQIRRWVGAGSPVPRSSDD